MQGEEVLKLLNDGFYSKAKIAYANMSEESQDKLLESVRAQVKADKEETREEDDINLAEVTECLGEMCGIIEQINAESDETGISPLVNASYFQDSTANCESMAKVGTRLYNACASYCRFYNAHKED